MRRAAVFTVLVALAAAVPAGAAPWETSGIDWTKTPEVTAEPAFRAPRPKRVTLANGLKLVVVENHAVPLVAMELVVAGAGSASDPRGKSGLAAFAADLLDEGAGGLGALELSDTIDLLGASITVETAREAAWVSVTSLTRTLDPTLEIFAKIVTAPAFDGGEATRVHGDRLTDLRLRRDRPTEVAGLLLSGSLYGRQGRYGRPTDGFVEEFAALTVEDARAFYTGHFHPAAMTLVVSGDVEAETLKKKLDRTLGAWKPAAAAPSGAGAELARAGARLVLVDRPGAEQSVIRLGTIGITRQDPRYYAVEVLTNVLGGTFTSRLNRRLREELGYTYGAGAYQSYLRAAGPFVISSEIFTPNTLDGLKEVFRIVADLAGADVPADELRKGKLNLIRALPQQFQSNGGIAMAYADLALHGLPDDWYDGYGAAIEAVTAEDVRAVARELLAGDRLTLVVVGDLGAVEAGLAELGLGAASRYDADGNPQTP